MINLAADHLGFVAASYAIAALVFGGLLVRELLAARRLKRDLAERGLSDPGQKDVQS
jgi:heme exporter protein CcmD